MITKEFLLEIFNYDSKNGGLYWKNPSSFRVKKGDRAGCIDDLGYRRITIKPYRYREHQLIWLIEHGFLPKLQIDHIDGNKSNNHINNLREVSNKQNSENRNFNKNNKLRVKGVYLFRNKYCACIQNNYKRYHLGVYKTLEDAQAAYINASKKMHTHNLFANQT